MLWRQGKRGRCLRHGVRCLAVLAGGVIGVEVLVPAAGRSRHEVSDRAVCFPKMFHPAGRLGILCLTPKDGVRGCGPSPGAARRPFGKRNLRAGSLPTGRGGRFRVLGNFLQDAIDVFCYLVIPKAQHAVSVPRPVGRGRRAAPGEGPWRAALFLRRRASRVLGHEVIGGMLGRQSLYAGASGRRLAPGLMVPRILCHSPAMN